MKPLHLLIPFLSLFLLATGLQAADKPNVVFMLADDLGWGELGSYGQEKIPTPNIDRLATQGTRFTQHYSGAAVCAPARCVLMTGKHLGNAEVRGNFRAQKAFPDAGFFEGQYPLSEDAVTMAQQFQKAGYATGAMGKWGMGPVGSTGDPNKKGFDLFYGYNCQAVAHSYYPPYLWRNAEQITINENPIPGHQKQPEGEVTMDDWIAENYAPKLMMDEALGFIDEHKDGPFFLYLAFIEPHVAMQPPKDQVAKFPEEWDTEPYRGEAGYLPHPRPHAGYAAMIHDLDDHVGRVLDRLDKYGLADNTIVVFTSDNGTTHPRNTSKFHVGGADGAFFNSVRDLRGWKGSLYEGGIRVPMIVRYPGKVAADAVNETPGYFADWFPTMIDAVGLEKPAGVELDGESLWHSITTGEVPESRNPMVWVFPEYGGQVAVRIGEMKVVRQGLKTRTPGEWEVYDLTKDRGETTDLSADHPELIQQAIEILKEETAENEAFPVPIPGVNA